MSSQSTTSNLIINTVILMLLTLISQGTFIAALAGLFIIPAVVTYVFCNHGIYKSIISTISVTIFLTVNVCIGYHFESLVFIVLALFSIGWGYVLGYSFFKGHPFSFTLTISVVIDFLLMLLAVIYCQYVLKINITTEIQSIVSETFFANFNLIKSLIPEANVGLESFEEQLFDTLYIFLPGLLPFAFFIVGILVFSLRYFISKILCRQYLIKTEKFSVGFDSFSPDRSTMIFLGFCALGVVLSTTGKWMMVFFCASLCVLTIYILSAFAIIDFKLKETISSVPKRVITILIVCFIVVLLSTVLPILNPFYIFSFIGLTDTIFDYRKIRHKKR